MTIVMQWLRGVLGVRLLRLIQNLQRLDPIRSLPSPLPEIKQPSGVDPGR